MELLASGYPKDLSSGVHADAEVDTTSLEKLCLYAAPGDDLDAMNEQIANCREQLLPSTIENGYSKRTMLRLAE